VNVMKLCRTSLCVYLGGDGTPDVSRRENARLIRFCYDGRPEECRDRIRASSSYCGPPMRKKGFCISQAHRSTRQSPARRTPAGGHCAPVASLRASDVVAAYCTLRTGLCPGVPVFSQYPPREDHNQGISRPDAGRALRERYVCGSGSPQGGLDSLLPWPHYHYGPPEPGSGGV
jgi:hypothetical protein